MVEKGRRALFFIAGLLIVGLALWRFYPSPSTPASLPTLWIFYARATGNREILFARHYSPRGRALGTAIRVGPLGLVQETQVAGAGQDGWEWVTVGSAVYGIHGGRVGQKISAPAGYDVLSVADFGNGLDGVAETVNGSKVVVYHWDGKRWVAATSPLPVGITTLAAGSGQSVWALIAQPDRAWLQQVSPGHSRLATPALQPQGTVGFFNGSPIVPYASGTSAFGYWSRGSHRFASVYDAAIAVTDTTPLWGIGVKGMIPFRHGQFVSADVIKWPSRQVTAPQSLGQGNRAWIAILDGFSQGRWFDVDTGQFGPAFQIKTPWWAVVRAASLGS